MAARGTAKPKQPLRAKKDRRVPAQEELPRIFSDKFLRELMRKERLPAEVNIPRFAAGVLDAAGIYLRDATVATDNEVHHEIDQLLRTADRAVIARTRKDVAYEKVAVQMQRLSERTRKLLSKRGALPTTETLRDPATQFIACKTVARLCRVGARWEEGRRRPGGKRSVTMVSVLHAPALQQHPARREAQLNFVMWLQIAYYEATGELPPPTAHPGRPSPFAGVVQACLNKVGAGANAVEMLNELQRRRNEKEGKPTARKKQLRERLSRQNP